MDGDWREVDKVHKNNGDRGLTSQEIAILNYIQALDEGDMEAVAAILEAAVNDPELDRLITEIDLFYQEEQQLTPIAIDAQQVRDWLRKHLRSAFETPVDTSKPLTVGDVASRLKDEPKLLPMERKVIELLINNTKELPTSLGVSAVKKLGEELEIEASDRFWRSFRAKAIFMRMGRSHDQAQLAAAREATAKRTTRKKRDKNPNDFIQ